MANPDNNPFTIPPTPCKVDRSPEVVAELESSPYARNWAATEALVEEANGPDMEDGVDAFLTCVEVGRFFHR
jgi:hypothetical protein